MFKITISNMFNSNTRSFEFNDATTAMSRFREHMDANNINDCHFYDDGYKHFLTDPATNGELDIMMAGGLGHDVRIEMTVTKPFSAIQSNDILHLDRVKAKLHQLGARLVAINDDVNMEFWQFENRMFIIQTRGRQFELFCSMEFQSMESAFRQLENVCRIQTFMS